DEVIAEDAVGGARDVDGRFNQDIFERHSGVPLPFYDPSFIEELNLTIRTAVMAILEALIVMGPPPSLKSVLPPLTTAIATSSVIIGALIPRSPSSFW